MNESRTLHSTPEKGACVEKLINLLTLHGKKSKAQALVQKTFSRLPHAPLAIFDAAITNVKPLVELRKIRISGVTHQVPTLISSYRQESIALRWILQAARKQKRGQGKEGSFDASLAQAIMEASKRQGDAWKKREELHSIAEANRAFAHYRWW